MYEYVSSLLQNRRPQKAMYIIYPKFGGGMTWWLLALSKVLPTKFCAMPMMVPCSEASPWWYALLRSVAGDGGDGDHGDGDHGGGDA